MSTVVSTNLLDAVFKVRQGENRAAALELIDRETNTVIKQADITRIVYTIFRRGVKNTIQLNPPPDEPIEGHINREIPVTSAIRDDPTEDPIDGVRYNFLYIIPCIDEEGNDITPFTESGANYDMVIRFIPFIGGDKYAIQKTIRIECI